MTNIRVRLLAVLVVLSGSLTVAGVPPATAATPSRLPLVRRRPADRAGRPVHRRAGPRDRPARLQRLRRDQTGGERRPALRLGRRRPQVRDRAARPRRRQRGPLPALLGARRAGARPGGHRLPGRRHRADTRVPGRGHPGLPRLPPGPALPVPVPRGQLVHRRRRPQVGRGGRELPQGVVWAMPLLGSEHHAECGRAAGPARFLAQRPRSAGRLPRHRPDHPGLPAPAPERRRVRGHRRLRSVQRAVRRRLRLRADLPQLGTRSALAVLRPVPGGHGRRRVAGQAGPRRAEPLLERQHPHPETGGRPARSGPARPRLRLQHPLLRPEGHLRHPDVGQGGRRPVRRRLRRRPRPRRGRRYRGRGQRVRPPPVRRGGRQGADRAEGHVPGPRLPPARQGAGGPVRPPPARCCPAPSGSGTSTTAATTSR